MAINYDHQQDLVSATGPIGFTGDRLNNLILQTYSEEATAITSTGTTTFNLNNGLVFVLDHTVAITTLNITNVPTESVTIKIIRTENGSSSISWPSSFEWVNGIVPSLTEETDVILATTTDGGATWYAWTVTLGLEPEPTFQLFT